MIMLGTVAIIAFLNRMSHMLQRETSFIAAFFTCLDLITIAVPPALPLVLTVGVGVSLQRLKKMSIYCIDPERLNYAGRLNVMCWDKTGTLTVPELFFVGMDRALNQNFSGVDDVLNPVYEVGTLEETMVCCHQLVKVDDILIGNALDSETVRKSNWTMDHDNADINIQGIAYPLVCTMRPPTALNRTLTDMFVLKRFEFDAHLQASSVICGTLAELNAGISSVYAKGSPEAMMQLCIPSTLPPNFSENLAKYSIQGYYVIACGYRQFQVQDYNKIKRKEVEKDLVFLGLLLYQNPLKSEAIDTMYKLKKAQIRNVIITGDHALTAIHACRQLKLCEHAVLVNLINDKVLYHEIPFTPPAGPIQDVHRGIESLFDSLALMPDQTELCITGNALSALYKEKDSMYMDWLIARCRIFSRINPDQKTWIVQRLMQQGKSVGMCGDGTNDCGALKAAHVGLALSDAEASIVAPFTSARKDISDVVHLVKHGRCALETSFVSFKFMTLYPMIQLLMSATVNQSDSALSNNQFFFDDMAIVTVLALLMVRTHPQPILEPLRPTDDLFHPAVLFSFAGQLILCVVFFFINIAMTRSQPWFCSVAKATKNLSNTC